MRMSRVIVPFLPTQSPVCFDVHCPASAPVVLPLIALFRLDRALGHSAPFSPRAVVHAHLPPPEQMGEDEPSGGGPAADGAVDDEFVVALQIDRREDAAKNLGGAERTAFVVEAIDRLMDSGGYVAGP